jgi:riboflavin synthase
VFTGIVRELGSVASFDDGRLVVRTSVAAGIGDSVAVDGVCLTVVGVDEGHLAFDVVPETIRRVKPFGAEVNIEPALRAGEPLGGHYVQGHVDAVGRVRSVDRSGDDVRVVVEAEPEILRYCVEKGSVTMDGVSLTIAELGEDAFAVALVPHTLEVTTLSGLAPGSPVNVEVDVLAKYVERLLPSLEASDAGATIRT